MLIVESAIKRNLAEIRGVRDTEARFGPRYSTDVYDILLSDLTDQIDWLRPWLTGKNTGSYINL